MNSYDLSRSFVDWAFENPSKICPIHYAVYFFAIEHCNRLGWKKEFGFPTYMAMEAIGVKKHSTFASALKDLEDWGFVTFIQRSKNQYTANIISLNALPKNGKALDKARSRQGDEQGKSTGRSRVTINKQENPVTIEQGNSASATPHPLVAWLAKECPDVQKLKEPLTNEEAEKLVTRFPNNTFIKKVFTDMDNWRPLLQKRKSAYKTFLTWASKDWQEFKETNPTHAGKRIIQ
jgi:hypothetical protein